MVHHSGNEKLVISKKRMNRNDELKVKLDLNLKN